MIGNPRQSDSPTAPPEDAYVLPLKEFPAILWRRAWIILLVTVVFAGTAVAVNLPQRPVYEASIKVMVRQERGVAETPTGVGGLQDVTATMAEAVASRPLAETVIQQTGLEITSGAFLERLSASQIEGTQFIHVSYKDTDPQRAQQVVNTVGEEFSEQISSMSSSPNAITATVWEPAAVPGEPVGPDLVRDGLLAALLGAVLGAGLALLLHLLDDRWRSPKELEQFSGVPVFGIIARFEAKKGDTQGRSKMAPLLRRQRREEEPDDLSGRLITVLEPSDVASEGYRILRTNLFHSIADTPPKVILLTSPGPREGKSTTCANLGVVLALADKQTLIVDCDLRKPEMHKMFGLGNVPGLTNVLAGEHKLQEVWQEAFIKGLRVLTVGPVPPNPAEVLSSSRFAQLLDGVRREFDYVLVDAPPTRLVSDPIILAPHCDGVLLVLDAQDTDKGAVRESLRRLEGVGANVLGTVMNSVEDSKVSGYDYRY